MHDTARNEETIVLIGVRTPRYSDTEWEIAWSELRGLVETAGGSIRHELVQNRMSVDPATVLGSGKLQELAVICSELKIDTAIFLEELTPAHIRTIESVLPCRVIDRTQVILDIFASRARSFEGKLQVELAQLSYLLPRLTGKGAAMSRLGGGIGTRGPGETKLETDRRHIRNRMNELRAHIKRVQTVRSTQKRTRFRQGIFQVALVGYTNAGKTSLLRSLLANTGADHAVYEGIKGKNRLFDTLDPTSKKIQLAIGRDVVFTDTVGFIQDLPHPLIDAFRSTLEETLDADLLLHVVDISNPEFAKQMQTVYEVLHEIGADSIPVITVFNKMDLCPAVWGLPDEHAVRSIRISAETGEGIRQLFEAVREQLTQDYVQTKYLIPYNCASDLSRLYQEGWILSRQDLEEGIFVQVKLPKQWLSHFLNYETVPSNHQ